MTLSALILCLYKRKEKKRKEKERERERERERASEELKSVKHHKHGFKTPVNHHIEYLTLYHTLILVIKYISRYNHLS